MPHVDAAGYSYAPPAAPVLQRCHSASGCAYWCVVAASSAAATSSVAASRGHTNDHRHAARTSAPTDQRAEGAAPAAPCAWAAAATANTSAGGTAEEAAALPRGRNSAMMGWGALAVALRLLWRTQASLGCQQPCPGPCCSLHACSSDVYTRVGTLVGFHVTREGNRYRSARGREEGRGTAAVSVPGTSM